MSKADDFPDLSDKLDAATRAEADRSIALACAQNDLLVASEDDFDAY